MYLVDDRMYKNNFLNSQSSLMTLNNTISQTQSAERKYPVQESNPLYLAKEIHHSNVTHDNEIKPEKKQPDMDASLKESSEATQPLLLSNPPLNNGLKETSPDVETRKNIKQIEDDKMDTDSAPSNAECSCSEPTACSPIQPSRSKKNKIIPMKKKPLVSVKQALPKSRQPGKRNASSANELRNRPHQHSYEYSNSQSQGTDLEASPPAPSPQLLPKSETARLPSSREGPQKKQTARLVKSVPVLEGPAANISFICTICNSRFKRFHSLTRHMKNIHPDYYGEWSKNNKRGIEDPDASNNKKFKWDGRMKRKISSPEENGDKKMKREFKCFFCSRYFKTELSLDRHTKTIHTSTLKAEKRKGGDYEPEPSVYVKRQKGDPKRAIQYSNYF